MLDSPVMQGSLTTRSSDTFRIGIELVTRQVYWRTHFLPRIYHRWRNRKPPTLADREVLRNSLQSLGVKPGALVMVHSSIEGIQLRDPASSAISSNPIAVASQILYDLQELVGESGTLAMPTHPNYPDDPGFMHEKSKLVFRYSPKRTGSRTGLLTELFRRRPGTVRSLHPLSSLACRGPMSDSLLQDNLNPEKPLPHGEHSAYLRFCRANGLIVSIGVPLIKCITALHVAEEVRDSTWPVKGFFYDRTFEIESATGGEWQRWTVRERRPEYVRSLALGQVRRDLLREGILHEGQAGTVRLDWANAGSLLFFMIERNRKTTYPYFLPRLARVT